MIDKVEIVRRLKEKLKSNAPANAVIEDDTDLASTLALDSMKLIELSLEIEDEFDVPIPLEELANVETPLELAELIIRKRQSTD